MREIKFRACHENVEIISHYQEGDTGYKCFQFLTDDGYRASSDYSIDSALESKDIVLMQYTGLKDKNGVEIYDGDVVKAIYEDIEESTHLVAWDYGSFSYPAFDLVGWVGQANGFSDAIESGSYTLEVIGNIYENPELLETPR